MALGMPSAGRSEKRGDLIFDQWKNVSLGCAWEEARESWGAPGLLRGGPWTWHLLSLALFWCGASSPH